MWKPKPCPSLSHGWNRNAAKRGVFGPWGIFRKHIDRQTCLRKPVCSTFVRVSSSIKTLVAPQNRTMSNPRADGQSTPWQENLRISWTRPKGDRLCGELQVCAFFTKNEMTNDRNIMKHHCYWSRLRHERDTTITWPQPQAKALLGKLFHVIPIKSFPKSPVHQRNLMASVVSTWTSPSGCRSETIADQTPDHRPQLSVPIIHGISLDL